MPASPRTIPSAPHDLVFAKARAALEALAVGTAVVVCDARGAGPMVTTENLAALRRMNFGIRALRHPVTPEHIAAQIERYDPSDAAEVSRALRETAGRDDVVERLLALYEEVIEEHASNPPDPAAEGRAASAYLLSLAPAVKGYDRMDADLSYLGALGKMHLRRCLDRLPFAGHLFRRR